MKRLDLHLRYYKCKCKYIYSVTDSNSHTVQTTLTVNVLAKVDETPVFTYPLPNSTSVENIEENDEGTGISLFVTMAATDADTGDTLTYALVSQSPSTSPVKFEVSGTILKQTGTAVFDYEDITQRIYTVTVSYVFTSFGSLGLFNKSLLFMMPP